MPARQLRLHTLRLSALPFFRSLLEPAPVVAQNPSAQDSAPEVASPVAPVVMEWPKVEVIWTEVKRFDPSTIPVEEGFYGGQRGNELSYNPEDLTDIPESAAYVWRILPQLSEENQPISSDPSKPSREIFLAAARNPSKDVVLVSIATSISPHYYILLSADGEKSWCMLNLLPAGESKNNTPSITRVVAQGEEIHLYGRYALGPGPDHLYWWGAVVKKSELPCS